MPNHAIPQPTGTFPIQDIFGNAALLVITPIIVGNNTMLGASIFKNNELFYEEDQLFFSWDDAIFITQRNFVEWASDALT